MGVGQCRVTVRVYERDAAAAPLATPLGDPRALRRYLAEAPGV
jgi:hypothetical protein